MAVSFMSAPDTAREPPGFLPRISRTTVERHVTEADADFPATDSGHTL